MVFGSIEVRGARENNLQGVSLDIPKRKLTVFTGVSGSGKSSLVFGTVAAESRRLIDETYSAFLQGFMPSPPRPDVDTLSNLSAAIVVDQEPMGANARSTVGTATDAYTMLRVIWSRLGEPYVGGSNLFSFNDPQGMCPGCEGLGRVSTIDTEALVDRSKSLKEGAITFPNFGVGTWYWKVYADSGLFDVDKPLKDYTETEWHDLMHGDERKVVAGGINVTYESLVPKITRLYLVKDVESMKGAMRAAVDRLATFASCPDCGGTRLNDRARSSLVKGKHIGEAAAMQLTDLAELVRDLADPHVQPILDGLNDLLATFEQIGLGYLSLDRESSSLSGGEAQRTKMVRHMGSALTDVTYVFDEPTIGLHPHDVRQMNALLQRLRDKGNTVLVVEHKPEVMAAADHLVDMGPGAGTHGGTVVYQGDLAGLRTSGTATGKHLDQAVTVKATPRTPTGVLRIEHANLHNLRDVSVDVPLGVLVAVTGVAGSGKSSLIHGCLPRDGVTFVDQSVIRGSRRSNPATYTGILEPIRKQYARANGVKPALFSANSAGACPECKGVGLIYTDLAFMAGVASVCEACGGKRFTDEVLGYTLRGKNIAEVLAMSVEEALNFFTEKTVLPMLSRLSDVGLDYISLGQHLNTLSGGERQRLKLAIEMGGDTPTFVLDEPTAGLHMQDVDNLSGLLDRLVDSGRSVIVVEHNLSVVARADWVIDMGPGGGHDGGRVVFEGTPADLARQESSLTGRHLAELLA
ncbi:excinuclease ABC subunit UvrA [Promicromonospora sukumoe]|uniref:UvrABC system protein A n=1 Tax=Promicromonospora sukumoe TaxID=88382 RepID=A0A7W3JC45_9MICO|nr:excinuclease ABC subunit UvrA [Promicromonospora sukumoe]MBA8810113.1 excinuclease UvrABC ATPase subunit [Promicromonospora sukumoe]